MKKIFVVCICGLLMASCGDKKQVSQIKPSTDLTLEQLDSIGKIFVPEIGTYGGTVRLPLGADPDGFCPILSSSKYSNDIMAYIYEGLVTLDPVTLEFIPKIAKKWEISEDGLVWTFSMRDDVYFTDGVKLSAYDVEFTFNDAIYNDKLRSPLNYNFRIKKKKIGVTALDSFTVQFTLPYPFAPFLTVAGVEIMPRHLYKKYTEDGTLEAFLSSGTNVKNVVGSGPFILDKVELGQRVVLKRNPTYWKKDREGNRLPYLNEIAMFIIKEPNVAMLKFKNGEIDHLNLLGEHYPILKPLEKEKEFTLYKVGPRWYDAFFVFNQNNQKNPKTGNYYLEEKKQKWLRNKNFRKACAYSINYQEIINIAYNGLAYPPASIWGQHKGLFHNPNALSYDYNPEKARELLIQEGFNYDKDSTLIDKEGNKVEFSLSTTAGVKIIKDIFEMVRKDLEKSGMTVHLNFIEFNNMMDKLTNTFDWDIAAYSLGGIIDPHFGKSTVTSTSFRYTINPQRKDKKDNLIPKKDRPWELRINEIFEIAVSEMDKEKRRELYNEWQEITMDQCVKVYLPLKEVILGVSNRFGNIHLTCYLALAEDMLHNIEEIYVKENQAK